MHKVSLIGLDSKQPISVELPVSILSIDQKLNLRVYIPMSEKPYHEREEETGSGHMPRVVLLICSHASYRASYERAQSDFYLCTVVLSVNPETNPMSFT